MTTVMSRNSREIPHPTADIILKANTSVGCCKNKIKNINLANNTDDIIIQ